MRDYRSSTRDSIHRYQERIRAQGLRQIQVRVPDLRSPAFAAECRRQSLLVAGNPVEEAIMDKLEALQDTNSWCS
jgi:Protein  of unknown function (DUF3018)